MVLEIEGDGERVDVGVVAVVDDETVVYPLFHLHTHGHRGKPGHALGNDFGRPVEVEHHGQAVYGILDRGILDKRYREAAMVLQVGIFDSGRVAALGNLRDVERFVAVFARPGYFAASEAELLDALADEPLDALVQDDVGHLAVEAGGG